MHKGHVYQYSIRMCWLKVYRVWDQIGSHDGLRDRPGLVSAFQRPRTDRYHRHFGCQVSCVRQSSDQFVTSRNFDYHSLFRASIFAFRLSYICSINNTFILWESNVYRKFIITSINNKLETILIFTSACYLIFIINYINTQID